MNSRSLPDAHNMLDNHIKSHGSPLCGLNWDFKSKRMGFTECNQYSNFLSTPVLLLPSAVHNVLDIQSALSPKSVSRCWKSNMLALRGEEGSRGQTGVCKSSSLRPPFPFLHGGPAVSCTKLYMCFMKSVQLISKIQGLSKLYYRDM